MQIDAQGQVPLDDELSRLRREVTELRRTVRAKEAEIAQLRRDPHLVPESLKPRHFEHTIVVDGVELAWDTAAGTCTFRGLPVALMWVDTTLAGLMAGVAAMVGPERFALALQSEGRRSVESDWMLVSRYAEFRDGFAALSLNAKVAGWGDWQLLSIDGAKRRCEFRVANNWEGLYQKALSVCWGSGMLAGKLAGICGKLFETNCWASQTRFVAKGDPYDEFVVSPSLRTVETEIEALISPDRATRADLAVAIRKLQQTEISLREQIAENALFQSSLRQLNGELEQRVAARTGELERVNRELKQSETRFRSLFEDSADAILLIESDRFIDCNRAALSMLRIQSIEQVRDTTPSQISPEYQPDGRFSEDKVRELIERAFRDGSQRFEWEHIRADGEHFLTEVLLTPIRHSERQQLHVVWRDITARKRAEAMAATLAAIVADANDAIWSKTLDGIVTSWNDGAKRLFGYSAEEIVGQSIQLLAPPDRRDEVQGQLSNLAQGGTVCHLETIRLRKDGSPVELSLMVSPLRDHASRIVGASVIARDISERKRVERLLEARLRIQASANSLSLDDLLRATLDEIETLTGSNVGFFHFFDENTENLSLQMWSTHTLAVMCSAEGKGSHYPVSKAGIWADAVRHKRPMIHNDYAALTERRGMPEGHAQITRELVVPIQRDGRVVAVVGVGNKHTEYDDTDLQVAQLLGDTSWEMVERKRLESRRQRLVDELSRSNTDLEQFAYVASHDLKAPLRAIDNLAVWLEEDLDEVLSVDSREHLALLRQRVGRMERLLNDLLTYSRAGRVPADVIEVEIRSLVGEIVDLLSFPPGFEIELPAAGTVVQTAVTPLRQIIANLIANAIKHHDRATGRVRVSVNDRGDELEFSVTDDGPGIPVEFHERAFAMFKTLRPRDEVEGSGIGLALVKRIVNHYGGQVSIENPSPRGTRLVFTWPKRIESYAPNES